MMNIKKFSGLLAILVSVTLSACQNHNSVNAHATMPIYGHDNLSATQQSVQCAPFDPNEIKICTAHYEPVCTTVRMPDGSTRLRTAGNACSACSLPDVISYVDGECER